MKSNQVIKRRMGLLIGSLLLIHIPILFSQTITANSEMENRRLNGDVSFNSMLTSQTITHHVVYRHIYDLSNIASPQRIWVMKMSADGSRLVFATPTTSEVADPRIYTIKTDGSELTQLFDYASLPDRSHALIYLDISGNGSKVIWTDGTGEIFIDNATGGMQQRLATTFTRPDGGTEGPWIRVWPRITADGREVYFIHTSGNPDMAGCYKVNADGSGQTQLFSYRELSANVFGMDGNEYNYYQGFDHGMAISDDGLHLVFGTRNFSADGDLIAYDGGLKKIYDQVADSEVPFALSRDGSQVLVTTNNNRLDSLITVNFSGGVERVSFIFKGMFFTPKFSEMPTEGAYVLYHANDLRPCLINTHGYGRDDLFRTGAGLSADDDVLAGAAQGYTVSLSSNGLRFSFATEPAGQPQQIWIADISGSLGGVPAVQQAEFIPNWALKNGTTSSVFKVYTNKAQVGISGVYVSSYWYGEWTRIVESALYDDGASEGDAVADDGIYTNSQVSAPNNPNIPDPVIPLTISACLIAGNRRVVSTFDIESFFALDQAPSGSGPVISSIEPGTAIPDSFVTVTGQNFGFEPNQNIVLFGNLRGWVAQVNLERSELKVVVPHDLPRGTVAVTVTVTVAALTSNAYNISIQTGINERNSVSTHFNLAQNYPNPFNSSTQITFSLPEAQNVSLHIYNLMGELVDEPIQNKNYPAGVHQVNWLAQGKNGIQLPSGIYFCHLQTDQFQTVRKLLLLR